MVAGVLGIAQAQGAGRRLLPLVVLGCVVAVHVFANATARFRLPWMPLVIVYASHAVFERHPLSRNALAAVAATLLFFFAVCVPHFRADAERLWRYGSSPPPTEAATPGGQPERAAAP